jgi:5-formyltetrahydrofolate cyclo-ligase
LWHGVTVPLPERLSEALCSSDGEDSVSEAADPRSALLSRRRDLSADAVEAASADAIDRLRRSGWLDEIDTIALYSSAHGEIDTFGLLAELWASNITTAVPAVDGTALEFRVVTPTTTWEPGRFGIREPEGRAVDAFDFDVALVPTVAFDRDGGRLGHGFGYYDRSFAHLIDVPTPARRTKLIGVAYDFAELAAGPRHSGDVSLDAVVTPTRWVTCEPRPGGTAPPDR